MDLVEQRIAAGEADFARGDVLDEQPEAAARWASTASTQLRDQYPERNGDDIIGISNRRWRG